MNINHSTGISYHLRAWGITERANLNNKIYGSTKGYFCIFFICSKISKLPPGDVCSSAQKHFSTEGSEPSVDRSVWFKLFETWKPCWLTKVGKRHVPVIAYGYTETLWIPLQLLWPRAPRTTMKGEKTVKVIRKITNLQLTGKKGISTVSSEVKWAHLGTNDGVRRPGRRYSLKHTEPYVTWEFCSGDASCAHTCICSEHLWAHVLVFCFSFSFA